MLLKHYAIYSWLLLLMSFCSVAQQDTNRAGRSGAFGEDRQEPELGLYEARVAVDGQGESVRQRAMSEGLQQVIVKLLGHEDAFYEPEIRRALNVPQQYIMQFSYEKGLPEAEDGEDLAATASADAETQTYLKMKFVQRRVDDLLRAANQIEAGELQTIAIEVQGVLGFADYAGTLAALRALPMVREVSPVLVQDEQVEFRLEFEGDIALLTAAMAENTRLHALDAGIDPVFADSLNYELR